MLERGAERDAAASIVCRLELSQPVASPTMRRSLTRTPTAFRRRNPTRKRPRQRSRQAPIPFRAHLTAGLVKRSLNSWSSVLARCSFPARPAQLDSPASRPPPRCSCGGSARGRADSQPSSCAARERGSASQEGVPDRIAGIAPPLQRQSEAFVQGLRGHCFVEGQNLIIER